MPTLLDRLRLSTPALALQHAVGRRRRQRRHARSAQVTGQCPICDATAAFAETVVDNPRESPVCIGCGSVPRQRALINVLESLFEFDHQPPRLHESSPSLATYRYFRRRCPSYLPSYWWPDVAPGRAIGPFRCVDLHDQPLPDARFDLVVTLDVLEHVHDPLRALRETARTLAPGGRFVFTVPRTHGAPTRERARLVDGDWQHLLPPEYHRDPVARTGTLVVTDWGDDLEARLAAAGLTCESRQLTAPEIGVPSTVEVFVATITD